MGNMTINQSNPETTIVLITGGNQGIGLEIGTVLSDLENYHIILGSRNPKKGEAAVKALVDERPSRSVSTVTSTPPFAIFSQSDFAHY